MKQYAQRAFLLLFIIHSCGDVARGDGAAGSATVSLAAGASSAGVSVSGSASASAGATGVATAPVVSVGTTTGTVALSAEDIARMNAEATAVAGQFKNQTILGKVASVAKGVTKVVLNPFTTLFSLLVPLGMFVYGFFDQAIESIERTDYMGSTMSIMVNPKLLWKNFMAAEGKVAKKLLGVNSSVAKSDGIVAPTAQELQASGWESNYTGSSVGITYDFGFAGAGDDLTKPFGFIRSATTGKYYYRPVRGQMAPASMPINNKKYTVDFHQHPFDVLIPRLMSSLAGPDLGAAMWKGVLDYTQLDPVKIFVMKTAFLLTSAFRNSFTKQQTKIDDAGQQYSKRTFVKYVSGDKGAAYPGIINLQSELSKLLQRLMVTPDVKRTILANGGQTMPSKWDPAKIVFIGHDLNPSAILLSVLSKPIKQALNAMFKADVNFYEYQASVDRKIRVKPSDVQLLYDHVRSLGSDASDIDSVKKSANAGAYIDGYMLKLAAVQQLVPGINWAGGTQDFTDVMMLFFMMRRLLAEIYVGIEFIVATFDLNANPSASVTASASASSIDGDGLQDQSASLNVSVGAGMNIDFDLLENQVLKNRVSALKDYAVFVKKYVDSFIGNNIGGSLIERRYVHRVQNSSTGSFEVDQGGPDDLLTYFPPSAQKQTITEFVSAVGAEAQKTLQNLDGELAKLNALIGKAKDADAAYAVAAAQSGVATPSLIKAKVGTLDNLVTALRVKQANARAFGLYPVGYDEKMLKIIELPGAVYLGYCLDYQMGLLAKPFEGDALYYYDDSFYDEDSAYLNLLAMLMRAQLDLSRAAAVVSGIAGPVQFTDAKGVPYTVPSGSKFYLDSLQKYDQYYLLQEQNLRQATAKYGVSSKQYADALVSYGNADKLLLQKKRDMNTVLRTFEFDRRHGVHYVPVAPIGVASSAATSVGVPVALVGAANSAVGAVTTVANASSVSALLTAPSVSASASVSEVGSPDVDSGIAGTLDDGTVVYTYERSVNGFMQEELARLAFRSRMLALDQLKEMVFAITGIQAQDLWTGVEAKKRQMLQDQQAALAAAKSQAPVDQLSLDQALALAGSSSSDASGSVVEEYAGGEADASVAAAPSVEQGSVAVEPAALPVPVVSGSDSSGVSVVAPLVLVSAPAPVVYDTVSSAAVTPVQDVLGSPVAVNSSVEQVGSLPAAPSESPGLGTSGVPVVSSSSQQSDQVAAVVPIPVAAAGLVSSGPVSLMSASDLDIVVANALARGRVSYNDVEGRQALILALSSIASDFSVAGVNNNGFAFSVALNRFVGLLACSLDPSQDVLGLFVGGLSQAMDSLAFSVGSSGVSDVNSFDNMLEVVTYLENGMLASQSPALGVMAERLNAWLRSH